MRFDKFWLRVTPIIRDLLPIGHAGSQSIFGKAFCSQAYLVFFPPPSPGEGPLTATKTSAPARGRAA